MLIRVEVSLIIQTVEIHDKVYNEIKDIVSRINEISDS